MNWIRLPYPPTVNNYWRHTRSGGHYISEQGRDYKNTAALSARDGGMRTISGPVELYINVYRPRKLGDLDNTLKAVLDALGGVAYADDSQVEYISITRFDNAADPHIDVIAKASTREATA